MMETSDIKKPLTSEECDEMARRAVLALESIANSLVRMANPPMVIGSKEWEQPFRVGAGGQIVEDK